MQELSAAIVAAESEVKTEPATESQLAAVRLKPVPGNAIDLRT